MTSLLVILAAWSSSPVRGPRAVLKCHDFLTTLMPKCSRQPLSRFHILYTTLPNTSSPQTSSQHQPPPLTSHPPQTPTKHTNTSSHDASLHRPPRRPRRRLGRPRPEHRDLCHGHQQHHGRSVPKPRLEISVVKIGANTLQRKRPRNLDHHRRAHHHHEHRCRNRNRHNHGRHRHADAVARRARGGGGEARLGAGGGLRGGGYGSVKGMT